MAVASQSLVNMTVPTEGGNQALLMPKLQHRFRLSFINFGVSVDTTDLTRQVIDVNRPQLSFEKISLPVYNSMLYLAGRHTWNELTVNLRDDINGSIAKLVGEQLQKQLDVVEQSSAVAGQGYKFQANIEVLDGGNGIFAPNVLESWEWYGCFITSANYQALSYSSNEPATIALTISYDNAVQAPLGSGVGINVGRAVGSLVTGIGS